MGKIHLSEKNVLFIFFISIITLGTILLLLPVSWTGEKSLGFIDALFTSVSAVCVTGLASVNTDNFSYFGKAVLLLLIQTGGLGLIAFSTMYLALPRQRLSIVNTNIIKNYFTQESVVSPRYIIKIILQLTLIIELTGALFLFIGFSKAGTGTPFYHALFHSVSAFCNAGFSSFPNGLEDYRSDSLVSITIMILIITGGMGFMVLKELIKKAKDPSARLSLHSKVMLTASAFLILSGALFYYIFEYTNTTMEGLTWYEKILPSFFQSVTTRTAGFNTIPQGEMTIPSKIISFGYMLIGGGSGSTAGGLKVTTAFLLLLVLIKGLDNKKGITVFNRTISVNCLGRAAIFFCKALALLFVAIVGISLSEYYLGSAEIGFLDIAFESFSALATVGLTLGITGDLNVYSKLILIFTMFAGRIGLFSLILHSHTDTAERLVKYPEGEVLIG